MFKMIKEADIKFNEKVNYTAEAKDFITRILCKNPKQRLGSQSDVEEILAHPWFKGRVTSGLRVLIKSLHLRLLYMTKEKGINNLNSTKKFSRSFED